VVIVSTTPAELPLRAIDLVDNGTLASISGRGFYAGNMPRHVPERMLVTALKVLGIAPPNTQNAGAPAASAEPTPKPDATEPAADTKPNGGGKNRGGKRGRGGHNGNGGGGGGGGGDAGPALVLPPFETAEGVKVDVGVVKVILSNGFLLGQFRCMPWMPYAHDVF
jgi:uncharacterized membrane protein YgcG